MAEFNLQYECIEAWPPLAWLAVLRQGKNQILLFHGGEVELRPDWFCEAAWPGEFAAGDFDAAEIVAGTGGRCREGRLIFVSPSSTVDRLHSLENERVMFVSNSLPCLLCIAGGSVPVSYAHYNRDFNSITKGLGAYKRNLDTSAGQVCLSYHDNLIWDGRTLAAEPKPDIAPIWGAFRDYRDYLLTNLRLIQRNASDPARTRAAFQLLATISTGYDSPTVAALSAAAGCTEALTFTTSAYNEDDCGSRIAQILGLTPVSVARAAWRQREGCEVSALASGQSGGVVFRGAEEHLRGRVLLTGFHGDKVWDMHNPELGPNLVRGDHSGLGLTELRLWVGFLHCPLPFWGARKVAAINSISNSAEMEPFVLPGTDYNRPICRRIVEEAGVPRGLFGTVKKAIEPPLWLESQFLTAASYADYFEWLKQHRHQWWKRFRVPPLRSVRGDAWLNATNSTAAAVIRSCARRAMTVAPLKGAAERASRLHPKLLNLRRYWFPWALERAKDRYATGARELAASIALASQHGMPLNEGDLQPTAQHAAGYGEVG